MRINIGRGRLLLLVLVSTLFAQLLPLTNINNTHKVYADTNLDRLCVLPTNDLGSDNHEPKGWLEVSFINRATLRVKYVGSGQCSSPSGSNLTFISANKKFSDVLDGDYIDSNTGDGLFSYVKRQGSSQADDSRIDQFDSGFDGDIADVFGGQDKGVSASTVTNNIQEIEYTISIEEDELSGSDITCSAGNANFVFTNINSDNKGFIWVCTSSGSSDVGSYKGLRIKNSIVGRLENFNITYNYQEGAIVHVSEGERDSRTFSWCQNENKFRTESCNGDLYIDATQAQLEGIGAGTGVFAVHKDGSDSTFEVTIAGSESPSAAAAPAPNVQSGLQAQPSCESEGGEMSWILCPTLRLMDGFVSFLDTQIQNLLEVPNSYFEGNAGQNLRSVWAQLRNIAYLLLVPTLLIMVIGTALGFEFINAYTVKKALPRLIIATIFIALSFELTKFLIIFTNNVGSGVLGVMTAPFSDGDITLAGLFDANIVSGGIFTGAVLLGVGATAVAVIAGAIGIILSFAFVTVVALLGGFLALAFRQMLLVGLVLLSPLAILAWIFPGNDKPWKLWWGTFSKLLLLYPLIMVVIASGRVFAQIIQDTAIAGDDPALQGLLGTVLKLTAYIAPFFFIPAMFKFAGGLFANLSGMVNDRSRGLFDRNKKYREGKRAELGGKFKTGSLGEGFRGTRGLMSAANRLGERTSAGARGSYGFGKRGKAALDIGARSAAVQAMKDPKMEQLQFDDDGVLAMALGAGTSMEAKRAMTKLFTNPDGSWKDGWSADRIDKSVATAASVGFNRANSTAALDMMARNKSFSLPGGAQGIEAIIGATDRLAGVQRGADGKVVAGNKQMADNLMGSFEFNSRQAGRLDLGMHDYEHGKANLDGAWSKASLQQHAQSAGPSTKIFAQEAKDIILSQTATQEQKQTAAIRLLELQNSLPYANAANQGYINQVMDELNSGTNGRISQTSLAENLATEVGIESDQLQSRARVYDQRGGSVPGAARPGGPAAPDGL